MSEYKENDGILKVLLESKAQSSRNVSIKLPPPPPSRTLSEKRALTSGSTIVLF
jgi:hypothetical protein